MGSEMCIRDSPKGQRCRDPQGPTGTQGPKGIIGKIGEIIKNSVFAGFFDFLPYMGLGMIWIAPKGCGEAPGHFPHQEKFHARFFKNRFF